MATYLILNLVFIVVVFVLLKVRFSKLDKATLYTLVSLLLLTLVFDNLIIMLSIVDYNQAKILGVKLGEAPIEDFFYAIVAAIAVPAIWKRLDG